MTFTHPGRLGDLLWALPTMRQLGGGRLVLHGSLAPLLPVLDAQPYVQSARTEPRWEVEDSAPRRPSAPDYEWIGEGSVTHLGYAEWPLLPLPLQVWHDAEVRWERTIQHLDLSPWIRVPNCAHTGDRGSFTPDQGAATWIREHHGEPVDLLRTQAREVLVHWTDRWCELKLGLLGELRRLLPKVRFRHVAAPGSRMAEAGAQALALPSLAYMLQNFDVVLTDCSMAHVLAAAVGVQHTLVVEPETDRHHEIFWPGSFGGHEGTWQQRDNPLGQRVFPVLGGNHRPTFDARHTADAVVEALNG